MDATNDTPAAPLTLTVEETAALLNQGLRQTYNAVRRGELPAVKLGARWFVKRAALYAMFGLDDTAVRPHGAREPHEPQDSAAIRPSN
jgi:excisionase family DNA binding protein